MHVLIITFGDFSYSNKLMTEALGAVREDITFEVFDVAQQFKNHPIELLHSMLGTIREYGIKVLFTRERRKYGVLHSRAFFERAHALIEKRIAQSHFDATLQTQSLFDASHPSVPNFVYTDHVANVRFISAWHGDVLYPSGDWFALETQIYQNAAHVFVFGASIRDKLIEDYGVEMDRVTVVGGAARPAKNPDTSPEIYAKQRILFVGREWDRKGGPDLIEAFRKLRKRLPEATLTIAGDAPKLDIEGCTVLGAVSRDRLDDLFRETSCFCMPSRLEPFGLVYVEAMTYAKPVVATLTGDIPDIVEHEKTGLLVPVGDPDALCDALYNILSAPELARKMGLAGMERAKPFRWESVAKQLAKQLPAAQYVQQGNTG